MSRLIQILSVAAIGRGHLQIAWDDGVTRDVDVSPWLSQHVLLDMLNDPQVFRDVSVVEGGGGIEWANGADFCAQALRRLSDEQIDHTARMIA